MKEEKINFEEKAWDVFTSDEFLKREDSAILDALEKLNREGRVAEKGRLAKEGIDTWTSHEYERPRHACGRDALTDVETGKTVLWEVYCYYSDGRVCIRLFDEEPRACTEPIAERCYDVETWEEVE